MDTGHRRPTPSLLPILRSRQQGEILTAVLGDPELEHSLTSLAGRLRLPYPSVHREIERAEQAGLVTSRRLGNLRLVKANPQSPYYASLTDVLLKAFGPPVVIATELAGVVGITDAAIFGSWAARYHEQQGPRPVGDIDLLLLGNPDRDALYEAIARASDHLGREIQVTIRKPGWLATGTGTFHDTVTSRPLVTVPLEQPNVQ
ncbi:MAG: winged helix-turn-helix domain-containing protein [Actinobacteria bacterium]|nr:winged helix-turn-helix domain-containing protein [Actinomycetota bacterium]